MCFLHSFSVNKSITPQHRETILNQVTLLLHPDFMLLALLPFISELPSENFYA